MHASSTLYVSSPHLRFPWKLPFTCACHNTGMQLARTTLVWHMRTKRRTAYRVAFAYHWSEVEGRHCAPPPSRRWVRCGRMRDRAMTISCAGARWARCTTRHEAYSNLTNCSTALVELKHAASRWRLAIDLARASS